MLRPRFAVLLALFVASSVPAAIQFEPPIVLESPAPKREGWFGFNVASVPDVTGDGRADILIGALGEFKGPQPFQSAGRAYLYDGVSRKLLRELKSPNEVFHSGFGVGACGIDDVNGDGRGDIVVATGNEESHVYVFSGATGDLIHALEPTGIGQPQSLAVSGIPDVTGDGRPEIAIGTLYFGDEGVKIYDGATGALLSVLWGGSGLFGHSASGIPDVNGDGRGDVIVGAPGVAEAYIYDGITSELLHTFTGANSAVLGRSVAGLGDVNGDGRGDVAVGASAAQRAYIYDGANGTLLHTLRAPGLVNQFGWVVNRLPDVNGDGRDDVVVGGFLTVNPNAANRSAYVFSGATGELLATLDGYIFNGGRPVAGLPDVNGDGLGEVLVANQFGNSTDGVFQAGQVRLYLSKAPPKPPEPAVLRWSAEGLHLRLTGAAGVKFELQRSDDLINWSPIATQTHAGAVAEFLDADAKNANHRFYRTRTAP